MFSWLSSLSISKRRLFVLTLTGLLVLPLAAENSFAFGRKKSRPAPTPTPTPTAPAGFSFDQTNSREAVRRAYLAVLFREPDAGGWDANQAGVLSAGVAGWKTVLRAIAGSAEFSANVRPFRSDTELLAGIYRNFLLRDPDDFANSVYLPMITAGRYADVVDAVGSADEFYSKLSQPLNQFRAKRTGIVRVVDAGIQDDGGSFNALGASLFSAIRWYRSYRARLERNLQTLADNGFDYVRVMGELDWATSSDGVERRVDPRWPEYDQLIAELTDLIYDKYGMRVEYTIFGSYSLTPSAADRRNLVDRFLGMSRGREHKIMNFEVANEAWNGNFPTGDGYAELRGLARYLKDNSSNLVAVTNPRDCDDMAALYSGGVASLVTIHPDRDPSLDGWRAARQPFGWDACPNQDFPHVASDDEPGGPGSSVSSESRPDRMIAQAITAWQEGMPFYTFHSSAGRSINGDDDSKYLSDMPGISGFKTAKSLVPSDSSYWARFPGNVNSNPVFVIYANGVPNSTWDGDPSSPDGVIRAHTITQGDQFFSLMMGVKGSVEVEARNSDLSFYAVDSLTGAVLQTVQLHLGERIRLSGSTAISVKGQRGLNLPPPPPQTPIVKIPLLPKAPVSPPSPPSGTSARNLLIQNQSLTQNQLLVSANGQFRLVYQGDGNLVLYRKDGAALWSSRTNTGDPGAVFMQADGNFVVYNRAGKAVWSSNTAGNPGSYVILQDDGNLVVYGRGLPLWASHTN